MPYTVAEDFSYGSLRALRASDVDGMLEWMHDPAIASVFDADFMSVTREKALAFVDASHKESDSLHLAIAGEGDEYLGTLSLKGIGAHAEKSAEYAIATRAKAHGTGAALAASVDLLRYAFEELGLAEVYLYVKKSNARAVAFYRKLGLAEVAPRVEGMSRELLWFALDYPAFIERWSAQNEKA